MIMRFSSKLPYGAAAVAFLIAGIGLLSGLQQIALALFALVPLAAGIGILRRRVWSAYGFALFEGAQLAVVPILLAHAGSVTRPQLIFTIGLNAVMVILFFFSGRALAASGAARGWASPWIALACLGSIPFFFLQAFIVPTGGMEDTLLIGDRILTRVFPKVKPSRGDIIVFRYPVDRRQTFVKRVIGAPGDHLRIDGPFVYLDGKPLKEPYAVHKFVSLQSYRDHFPGDPNRSYLLPNSPEMLRLKEMLNKYVTNGELIVPPGEYFVLGDNRDNSLDSRYWGFVDAGDLIGKPILIYDSQEPLAPGTAKGGLRAHQVRWRRMFKPL